MKKNYLKKTVCLIISLILIAGSVISAAAEPVSDLSEGGEYAETGLFPGTEFAAEDESTAYENESEGVGSEGEEPDLSAAEEGIGAGNMELDASANEAVTGAEDAETDASAAETETTESDASASVTETGICVGIIDTGFDLTDEIIAGKYDQSASIKLYAEEDSSISYRVLAQSDYSGNNHGTNIARITARESEDALGSMILVDAAVTDNGSYTASSVAKAILYLSEKADVINISLGAASSAANDELSEACMTAYQRGVTIICAAGNGTGTDPVYPSDHPDTISVLAVNEENELWSGSGSGSLKDIAAPGVGVEGVNGEYCTGTSVSAAFVSAAVVRLLDEEPSLSMLKILELLTDNTSLQVSDANGTYPVLNAEAALLALKSLDNTEREKISFDADSIDISAKDGMTWYPGWESDIVLKYKGHALKEGVDYSLVSDSVSETVYDDDITLRAVLKGLDVFEGSITLELSAEKRSIADCTGGVRGECLLSGGGQVCPYPSIRYENGGADTVYLSAGKDYQYTYGANDQIGKNAGVIHAAGMGPYCGTLDIYFDIFSAEDIIAQGKCGENTEYALYGDGSLVISGTGIMICCEGLFADLKDKNGSGVSVRNVRIEEGVTGVSTYAFAECSKLERVVLPESLEYIEERAFAGCTSLHDIVLPEKVSSIGEYVFERCSSLESIIIPYSVSELSEGLFSECRALREVKLSEGLVSIGNDAFIFCRSLKEVSIPESVSWIGSSAFNCSGIESVVFPKNADEIMPDCFRNCASLVSVEIPEGIEKIGEGAFEGCGSLESVYLPDSVTEIAESAFAYCGKLSDVRLPAGLGEIEAYTFRACAALEQIQLPQSVTVIGYGAFTDCRNLSSIELPGALESLGEYVFYGCTSLTEINIPKTLASIGKNAFTGSSIEKVYMEDAQKWCEVDADSDPFDSMPEIYNSEGVLIDSLTLPKEMWCIPDNAYRNWKYLKSIELPASISCIGNNAFEGCTALESVSFGEGEMSLSGIDIGDYSFKDCTALQSLGLPDSVVNIGTGAFMGSGLKSISLPLELTEISDKLFYGCRDLTDVDIHVSKATYIGKSAFEGCVSLEYISLPEGLEAIGESAFKQCQSLTTVYLPDNVREIRKQSFYGCSMLEQVEIPPRVTEIGEEAFSQCVSLSEAATLENVVSFGHMAFGSCPLSQVIISDHSNVTDDNRADYFDDSVDIRYIRSSEEGACGDNAYWRLTEDGKLIIEGTGEVDPYTDGVSVWNSIASDVKSVDIHEGISSIGDKAFYGMKEFESLTLPESLDYIGKYSFAYCSGLKEFTLPRWTYSIGTGAFYACSSLENIEKFRMDAGFIGDDLSLRYIGDNAFAYCTSLCLAEFTEQAAYIGSYAFNHCSGLTDIVLSDGLEEIKEYTFFGCSSLIDLQFMGDTDSPGIRSIGEAAFGYCSSLQNFIFPEYLRYLGDKAFIGCTSLYDVYWDSKAAISEIGDYTFYNCRKMFTDEGLPESVERIGKYAFYNCAGFEIYSDTVKEADDFAFAFCDMMDSEHLTGTVKLGENVFLKSYETEPDPTFIDPGAPVINLTLAAGEEYALAGFDSPDAVITTSCAAVASEVPYISGEHRIRANAPGTATVVYRDSAADRTMKWLVRVVPPIEKDPEGYYKETGQEEENEIGIGECAHNFEHMILRRPDCCHDGASANICTKCGYTEPGSYRVLQATGVHVFDEGVKVSEDLIKYTCKDCGTVKYETVPGCSCVFRDVNEDDFYYMPVVWAAAKKITTGTTPDTFSPDTPCLRSQVVTFLWRAAGSPQPKNTKNPFTDISTDSFYYEAVLWAYENNITTGTTATTFSPDAPCLRSQVVTFLWRASGKPEITSFNTGFTDVPEDTFYEKAVLWALRNGITTGTTATTFSPNNLCLRGQVVTFLYRNAVKAAQ